MDLASYRARREARRRTGSSLRRPSGLGEDALEKALHCVARISGEVGHELNNQLAVILNYTYVLGRRLQSQPTLTEHLSEMRRAVWSASDLAGQLRHFGHAQRIETEATDLSALITELEPVLRHGLDPDRELDVRIDPTLHPVAIARGPLESMLLRAALIKHGSGAPGGALNIHAYNGVRPADKAEEAQASRPCVQLQVGPLPVNSSMRPRQDDQADSSTAGQLLSERVRAGLAELGAELDLDECDGQLMVSLWLPAAE